MHTVAVIAEKGGVGKTTIALTLAVGAVRSGKRSAVIDIDPQATASKWTDRRTDELPWVVPTHAARLRAAIDQAQSQGVTFLVIDTPPHAGADAVEAARVADLVVIPVEPHLFTLETLPKLTDLLKLAGNPLAFVVVNKAGTQGKEGEQASEHVRALGIPVCPVVIHQRAAHRHAGNVGLAATEFEPNGKAAQESIKLYTHTIKLLENRSLSHGQTKPTRRRA